MRVFVRAATLADIRQMAEIAGPPVTARSLADWMDEGSAYAAWHVIEDEAGALLGFQQIGRSDPLARDCCDIATFLHPAPLPPGAAARLFETTADHARLLGYAFISARIATGNETARTYYQSQGFRQHHETLTHLEMRFDLD